MKKLKEIIRKLGLQENEVIITRDELEKLKINKAQVAKTKNKTSRKQKRKKGEIVWSDENNKVQIRQRSDALYLYYYDKEHKKIYQKRGTLEELIIMAERFKETGYDINKFYESTGIRPRDNPHKYIYKHNGTYIIHKRVNRKQITFGRYSDIRFAEEIKSFLIYKKWDLKYKPENVTPAHINRFGVDDYYRTMKPIMFADREYQNYIKKVGL